MGHVREEFQMRRGKMGKQTQLEKTSLAGLVTETCFYGFSYLSLSFV